MTLSFKFAAVVIVLAIVASPVFGAVTCPNNQQSMMCCPHCRSMAMAHSSSAPQLENKLPAQSCCDLSTGKPAPAASIQAPVALASISAPASTFAGSAAIQFDADRELPLPFSDLHSPQSVLCTFLI